VDLVERGAPPLALIEEALSGDFKVHGDLAKADCVIGFSFGYRREHSQVFPGLSNEDLANVALKYYNEIPKILQFEIADAYGAAGGHKEQIAKRITKHRQAGSYLDTHEVAAQAKLYMAQRKWRQALLLAHPHHLPRVDAVCRMLGMQTIVTEHTRGAVEFDLKSAQKWTRSLKAWCEYEPEAIELYRLRGWL